jgi:hypothetical protein
MFLRKIRSCFIGSEELQLAESSVILRTKIHQYMILCISPHNQGRVETWLVFSRCPIVCHQGERPASDSRARVCSLSISIKKCRLVWPEGVHVYWQSRRAKLAYKMTDRPPQIPWRIPSYWFIEVWPSVTPAECCFNHSLWRTTIRKFVSLSLPWHPGYDWWCCYIYVINKSRAYQPSAKPMGVSCYFLCRTSTYPSVRAFSYECRPLTRIWAPL